MGFCEFQAVKFTQRRVNRIDVRENDKDVREVDVHLAEVRRTIDPFDFAPALTYLQRHLYNDTVRTSAEERDQIIAYFSPGLRDTKYQDLDTKLGYLPKKLFSKKWPWPVTRHVGCLIWHKPNKTRKRPSQSDCCEQCKLLSWQLHLGSLLIQRHFRRFLLCIATTIFLYVD